MNTLPCLVLYAAFAAGVLNESTDTERYRIYYNYTLRQYLTQHEDFDWALYHTYAALEGLLTGEITRDLKALAELVAKGSSERIRLVVHLTCKEYQHYRDFYLKRMR